MQKLKQKEKLEMLLSKLKIKQNENNKDITVNKKSANKQQCENRKSQCLASCSGLNDDGWLNSDQDKCESKCYSINCY